MSPHKVVVTLCNHSSLKCAECASKARHEDSCSCDLGPTRIVVSARIMLAKLKRHGNEHTTPYEI